MINWPMIKWEEDTRTLARVTMKVLEANIGPDIIPNKGIGIDPGRNFGMAMVHPDGVVEMYHGYLHINKDWGYGHDGMKAMDIAFQFCSNYDKDTKTIIEGAAHATQYGQANLAYVRQGFFIGSAQAGMDVEMAAINTIRKHATGDGRKPMYDLLPNVNIDACAALGCALYASGFSASSS